MTITDFVENNIKKIEIENGNNRKLVIDGKEIDLSKLKSVNVIFDCDGLQVRAKAIGIELPRK